MTISSSSSNDETSPLMGLKFVGRRRDARRHEDPPQKNHHNEGRKNLLWTFFLSGACVVAVSLLTPRTPAFGSGASRRYAEYEEEAEGGLLHSLGENAAKMRGRYWQYERKTLARSPYVKVQTLSFQIYTGGAPAFVADEFTGEEERNRECEGLHSYGRPEDSEALQCYLGLEDTAEDVQRRLKIMRHAIDEAYNISDKDDSTLKIFLAPEFFFRGLNGAFQFLTEEEEEESGECSDICHILRGLEDIVADERFEDWLFLFGTVIASETLPKEDRFDYQFYNFAPLYKGFDPARSRRVGKNFIVPKRYVSNIDFLSPVRDLTNRTMVMELLDEKNQTLDRTLMNPHASGRHRYDNDVWAKYKDELESLGYNMIEYGWFYMDGIAFSVEICLDHLVHRALMTYMADVVTGSKTRVPSSARDSVEWVGIPKRQAQVSLVSSAGMDVEVSSLALADGGHVFLQDGTEGNVAPRTAYGQDDCKPNEYEFFGGSQCVKRTAVISATDVTFKYEMNMEFRDYELYPENGLVGWKDALSGVFSTKAYPPKLTVYDPVDVALTE